MLAVMSLVPANPYAAQIAFPINSLAIRYGHEAREPGLV